MIKSYDVPEEKRKELGNYIKSLREKRKYGFNQFALKSNLNVADLNRIEKGDKKKINAFQLRNIATALRIDYKELYKIVGYLDEDNDEKEKSNIGPIIFEEMINIPVYDSVSAGCQAGLEPNPEPIEYVSLPKRMAEGCVIVNVHGESMKPTLNDGSSVLIKLDSEVGHNEIGVFIYDDEPLVKRYKCFDGKRFLYSDNHDYPPREVREETSFTICGKVIWIMAKQ